MLTAPTSSIPPAQQLSPDDEKKLIDRIKARWEEACRWDQPFKSDCFITWKYKADTNPEEWPYWSNIFESATRTVSDEVVEQVMSEVYQRDRPFVLTAGSGQNDLAREKLERTLRYALERQMRYNEQLYHMFRECVDFGNAWTFHFTKPCHVRRYVGRQMPGPLPGMVSLVNEVENAMEFWLGRSVPSRFDITPAPIGATVDEMPYCFIIERCLLDGIKWEGSHNRWAHLAELKGMALHAANEGMTWLNDTSLSYSLPERLAAIGYDVRAGVSRGTQGDLYAEKLWYFEAAPWGTGCGRVTLVSEWKVLADWAECPWLHGRKPISEYFFTRLSDPRMWHGLGLPKLIRSAQESLNEDSSLVRDVIAETAFPMLLIQKDKLADKVGLDWFDFYPGRKIPVIGTPSDVSQPVATARIPAELWQHMDLNRASIQRLSKIADATRNLGGARTGIGDAAKTATGLAMIRQDEFESIIFKLLYNEEGGGRVGLELDLANLQQLFTEPRLVPVGDPGDALAGQVVNGEIEVGPEDVAGQWQIEPVGASEAASANKKVQRLQAWAQQMSQIPEVWAQVDKFALARLGARMLDVPDIDKLLPPDAEQRAAAAAQAQQQAAQIQQQIALQNAGMDMERKKVGLVESAMRAVAPGGNGENRVLAS